MVSVVIKRSQKVKMFKKYDILKLLYNLHKVKANDKILASNFQRVEEANSRAQMIA